MSMRPTHNLCIGRPVPGRKKNAYTAVGVGWWDPETEQMMVTANIRLLLEPSDKIYLFLRKNRDAVVEDGAGHSEIDEVF